MKGSNDQAIRMKQEFYEIVANELDSRYQGQMPKGLTFSQLYEEILVSC